jgi:ferredoxin-NADP reductase
VPANPPRGRLPWRLAELLQSVRETPRVRSLIVRVPGWPGHLPGQHVDVRLTAEDGYQAQRSYSIAAAPEEETLTLTVERLEDGEVSPYLTDELRPGDRLELRGPIGNYFVWTVAAGGPLFLVAGGSGVVPLMAMLRHRAAAGSEPLACLLYSARSEEEIIYRKELDQLAAASAGLRVFYTLTRSRPPGWTGYDRRIDRPMIHETAPPPGEHPHIFICGPTLLVESVATLLVELGHDPGQIKTERFGPTGG